MSNENETPVYVVYQQDLIAKNNIALNNFHVECKEIVKDITKHSIRKKLEVMKAEYERANDKRNLKFSRLLETVEKANAQDNQNTDKFLDNVESIMKVFTNELKPLENIYESLMNRLSTES